MPDEMQGATTGARETTAERLALLSATDAGGKFDEAAYRVQKMVLDNRTLGGVDAAKLVEDMVAAPGYVAGRKQSKPFIEAIQSRLDAAQIRQFERALDAANITDTGLERAVEKTGGGLFGIGRWLTKAVHWVDDHISDGLKKVHDWADRVSSDPDANPLLRVVAGVVEKPVEVVQVAYGVVKAPVMKITGAVEDVGEVGKFAYRFATHPHYRDALFAMAKLELAESTGDLGKVAGDVLIQATTSLDKIREDFEKARADGKEAEYLGQLTGIKGFDTISKFISAGALEKLHGLATTLDSISLDQADEVKQALDHAAKAIAKGGAAGEAGADVWQAMIRESRDQGELSSLVTIARESGHLDVMLKLGELSPREIGDLARLDPGVFKSDAAALATSTPEQLKAQGGATFDEALNATLGKMDLSKLDARQAGEVAEAVLTRDMLRAGYTEIATVQTHGDRDLVMAGRNAKGEIETFQVDAEALAKAAKSMDGKGDLAAQFEAQLGTDPRLAHAAAATQTKAPTAEIPAQTTTETRTTAVDPANPYAKLAHANVQLNDPSHHDHPLFAEVAKGVYALDAQLGRTPDARSDQLSGALAVAARKAGITSADHVVLSDDASRVFIVQGDLNSPLHKLAYVETVAAMNKPLSESTAAMAQIEAAQSQQKTQEQTTVQQQVDNAADPSRKPAIAA